jgi:hypothetical protein
MLRMIIGLVALVSMGLSQSSFAQQAYRVDCPSLFLECAPHIGSKLSDKFLQHYPAGSWKIVVPNAYVFRMGNGSLKGYFPVSVIPIGESILTNDFNNKKPLKRYESIRRISNAELKGDMFDNALFQKNSADHIPGHGHRSHGQYDVGL